MNSYNEPTVTTQSTEIIHYRLASETRYMQRRHAGSVCWWTWTEDVVSSRWIGTRATASLVLVVRYSV